MDNNFTADVNNLRNALYELADRARDIITGFLSRHGGCYTFDIENDQNAWVGEETYVTALETETTGNVLVCTSDGDTLSLGDMADYIVVELANDLNNIDNNN